jgi:hypothetical protein
LCRFLDFYAKYLTITLFQTKGRERILLTQFDPARRAVINPEDYLHPIENFPETVVSIFSHELFNAIVNFLGGRKIAESRDVDGYWPIYEVT